MGNFGMTEILVIMVIILLLFGAKRIPEIAGSFGKGINEFKRNISDAQRAITDPARGDDARNIAAAPPPPVAAPLPPEEEAVRQPKRLIG